MISILLQLYGSTLLVWNALNKSKHARADEIRLVVPQSIDISKKEAEIKQREYCLSIFGFLLISIGYFLQLFNIDLDILFSLTPLLTILAIIGGFSFLLLIVFHIARATSNSFFIYANKNIGKGKRYIWFSGDTAEQQAQAPVEDNKDVHRD